MYLRPHMYRHADLCAAMSVYTALTAIIVNTLPSPSSLFLWVNGLESVCYRS